MKNKRKIIFILCALIPFAVWLAYFFISGFSILLGSNSYLLSALIIYTGVVLLSFLYGAIKFKCEVGGMSGKTALTLTVINAAALIFMLWAAYNADYSFVPSPCSVLICLGAISVLYWAILTASKKENMTAKTLKRQLCFCILIPLIAALCLNFNSRYIGDTMLMSAGTALLVAAVCFIVIFIFARFNTKNNNPSTETSSEPQTSSFYKFCNNTVLIIIFAVVLPQICLCENIASNNLLGNYKNPLFFVLALFNGILMLPAVREKFLSLPYLYLKSVCFTLICYFTIIFMPVLPLGLIGIIAAGLGLLVFVPLFLFIMETGQLYYEARKLQTNLKTGVVAFAIIGGLATIPALFCINAAADRVNLNNALTYLDVFDTSYPTVDTPKLLNTIEKSNNVIYRTAFIEDLFEDGTPLLDGVYREIVFDGAYLTNDAKNRLDSVFNPDYLGSIEYDPLIDAERGDDDVILKAAEIHTAYYDEYAGAWATEITLMLENKSDSRNREFSEDFYLPDGLLITDFWLDIGGEKREGLITDKRAALLTYDAVVTRMQDPAVIYYKDDNTIQLNVFPFDKGEVRTCGFTILHSGYETIEIEGMNIALKPDVNMPEITLFDGGALIPAPVLYNYPEAERKPYYCFAFDMSADVRLDTAMENLLTFVRERDLKEGMIYFASEKVTSVPLSELENAEIKDDKIYIGGKVITKSGGFNLSGAFGTAQLDALKVKGEYYPALIVVTDYSVSPYEYPPEDIFLPEFPENNCWYELLSDNKLRQIYADGRKGNLLKLTDSNYYNLTNGALQEWISAELPAQPCVITPYGIAANNGRAQIVYNNDVKPEKRSLYSDALALYARSLENPYDISNVKDSIKMNVLCPSTAFSVFETKEQINQLLETQKRILSGDYLGQAGEITTLSMDEGSDAIFITAAVIVIGTALSKRKKTKKKAKR